MESNGHPATLLCRQSEETCATQGRDLRAEVDAGGAMQGPVAKEALSADLALSAVHQHTEIVRWS